MELLFMLLGNVCITTMIAYLLGRSRTVQRWMLSPPTWQAGIFFTLVFSALSIVSSYYGTRISGALASTRIVGTLMGGIIGGPYVGLAVGLLGGLHRYSLGGFTAVSCGIATALAGLMAGLVRSRYTFSEMSWKTAALIALMAEVMQKGLTLIFAKPFEQAWAFEKVAAIPTTCVTIIGTVLFLLIMKDMHRQSAMAGAEAAQKALAIATESMPYLRKGLTPESARKTAELIVQISGAAAVAITDTETVLGYAGVPSEGHQTGLHLRFPITYQVLKTGRTLTFSGDHGCGNPDCPLAYGVVVPLTVKNRPVGTIRIYQTGKQGFSPVAVEMAEGMARLLSTQIELADYEQQQSLREQAEFKALQSQINPHFLFNTLSIIISFCRTDPATARELLINLSDMLHFNFAHHEAVIPLEDEYANVMSYLNIVKARFGSRLTIDNRVDPDLCDCLLPAFTLQPLVENAITHGLFPKTSNCILNIDIYPDPEAGQMVIKIIDNGVGMSREKCLMLSRMKSKGIGVANVLKRLRGLYKERSSFNIDSREGSGTTFTLRIPMERKEI